MSFAARFLGPPGPAGFSTPSLEEFVKQGIEENLNLDYKDIRASDNPDKLAQTVCAFANSEGGLLVLGVVEQRDTDEKGNVVKVRPGKVTWAPKSVTKEAVESRLIVRIHRWIQGLRIYPVRNQKDEAIFLIDVPQSPSPPHQASDQRYYLRYNFQNLPMDHHQVEALFYRRMRPNLYPSLEVLATRNEGREVDVRIGLSNIGGALAKQPLFFCTATPCNEVVEKEGNFFFRVRKDEFDGMKFYVNSQSPIGSIHPLMVNYQGTVVLKYERSTGLAIMIGAEDMPTKQFVAGVSASFFKNLKHDFSKSPLRLTVISDEDTDIGKFNEMLR